MTKKKIQFKVILFSLIILLSILGLALTVYGQTDLGLDQASQTGLGTQDLRVTIANVIRVFLGLLGLVAVGLLIYGGWLYMTAAGEVEKIQKAKKLLIGAVIGLLIILTAFAIVSFIISAIQGGSGIGTCDSCEAGASDYKTVRGCDYQRQCSNSCWGNWQKVDPACGDSWPPTTYCANPGSDNNPWVCLKINQAKRGRIIQVVAGNVGSAEGQIFFKHIDPTKNPREGNYTSNEYPAEIVKCNEDEPNWFVPFESGQAQITLDQNNSLGIVSVKVPAQLTLADNDYYLVVKPADNPIFSFQKDWPTTPRKDTFILSSESTDNDPNIICFTDNNNQRITGAAFSDPVKVKGVRFGTALGRLDFNQISATVEATAWTDTLVTTTVPKTSTGDVILYNADNPALDSGPNNFDIFCTSNDNCSTDCCYQKFSKKFCTQSAFCDADVGEPCNNNPQCLTDTGCQPGLYCDLTQTPCSCQARAQGAPCDDQPGEVGCQAQDTLCAQGFYCSVSGLCTCQTLPKITAVDPVDGKGGSFVTVWGQGFGEEAGHVYFIDALNVETEAVYPLEVCQNIDIWSNRQVIIEIPGVLEPGQYQIKLKNSDGLEALWTDKYFTVNTNLRPALCGLDKMTGVRFGDVVSAAGKNFSSNKESALVGGKEFSEKNNWQWTETTVSNLLVPNFKPGTLPVQIKVGNNFSNKVNLQIEAPFKVPTISGVEPSRGPVDQYITISGSNFGSKAGTVKFYNANTDIIAWKTASTDFPADCAAVYWQDNNIVVKVPNVTGLETGDTKIAVITYDTKQSATGFDNATPFFICTLGGGNCNLTPGICAIKPNQGPIGTTDVTIYGDNFGELIEGTKAVFGQQDILSNQLLPWTNKKIGSGLPLGQLGAGGNLIVPLDPLGAGIKIGQAEVKVVTNGLESNKVKFNLFDCRTDEKICNTAETNKICCERDGICQAPATCEVASAQTCNHTWHFTTGTASASQFSAPQVVEQEFCVDSTQSPSPFMNSNQNCANALISARFTQTINSSSLNTTNIIVKSCGNEAQLPENPTCSQSVGARMIEFLPGDVESGSIGFTYYPITVLQPNTWYQVTLSGGANGIRSIEDEGGLVLDGDGVGGSGGDYIWYFRIRNSANACPLDKVLVSPSRASVYRLIESQKYSSVAIGAFCTQISPYDYDWGWYKTYCNRTTGCREEAQQDLGGERGLAVISLNKVNNTCDTNICRYTRTNCTNSSQCPLYVNHQQIATPKKQGIVNVGAEVFPVADSRHKKDDDNLFVIDLNIPVIQSIYPADGLVHPAVNSYVTISGYNFGSTQGSSNVYFDQTLANVAQDCSAAWSDTQIKVKVPQSLPVKTEGSPVYVLPAAGSKPGMILYYNFDNNSKVIASDSVGQNDGEIKGSIVEKVDDQFNNALRFNTSSLNYVKIPNTLDLETGSIEMWFKPEQYLSYQTLFSVSNGANDVFAITLDELSTNLKLILQLDKDSADGGNIRIDNTPIRLGQWNHLVYTYDGSKIKVYLNGVKSVFNQSSAGFISGVSDKTDITLGNLISNIFTQNYYNGLLDNFAVYNKVLTDDEVWQNYGINKGQILLLHFDEIGSQLVDSSPNKFSTLSLDQPLASFRTAGKFNNGIYFYNYNRIKIADNYALAFNKEVSIEGWVKTQIASHNNVIYEAQNMSLKIMSNKLRLTVKIQKADGTISDSYDESETALKINDWNYFAAVYDGQQIKVYLNGNTATGWPVQGTITQTGNYYSAGIGGLNTNNFAGNLDEFALYNRALSPAEISSRLGAQDNSHLVVKTAYGQGTSSQTYKYSSNVYPFLCSLNPNFGTGETAVAVSGDNFGDSNKTTYQGTNYDLGSYVQMGEPYYQVLFDEQVSKWTNKLISYKNSLFDIFNPEINVFVSIDPYSEPYVDSKDYGAYGQYDAGIHEPYADTNNSLSYNKYLYPVGTEQLPNLTSNALPFYAPPVITHISPNKGPNQQWVSIYGYNFGEYYEYNSKVIFYNNREAELAPCIGSWSDNLIIVSVPDGAQSGDLYIQTANNLISNKVKFEVTNQPIGAQLCPLLNPACNMVKGWGSPGETFCARGNNFDQSYYTRGEGQLVFTQDVNTESISSWVNQEIKGSVPQLAQSGEVVVMKKLETGRKCAGFSIGSWCPSGRYDITYDSLPSNSVPYEITGLCATGFLNNYTARQNSVYPVTTIDADGNEAASYTGLMASDGTYLYTMSNYLIQPADNKTIYKIGTGYNGTTLGRIYRRYQYDQAKIIPSFLNAPEYNALAYQPIFTMTATTEGLYLGEVFYSKNRPWETDPTLVNKKFWGLAKVVFDDNDCLSTDLCKYGITFQELKKGSIKDDNADWAAQVEGDDNITWTYSNSAAIASNGKNLYIMSWDLPGGSSNDRKGYTFQVLNSKLEQVKIMTVPNKTEGFESQRYKAIGNLRRFVVDNNYLYVPQGMYQRTIDLRSQQWKNSWQTCVIYTREMMGQYDWINRRFWFGTFTNDYSSAGLAATNWASPCLPMTGGKHNRIYSYEACRITQGQDCTQDSDCNACGVGNSRCVNGLCTPYIQSFQPTSGPVGQWATLSGCYFGCKAGTVYFTGYKDGETGYFRPGISLGLNCLNSWRCSADHTFDQIIVEVPDKNTTDTNDDAITGPIKVQTADFLSDTTAHLAEPNFTVNSEVIGPQICRINPDYGNPDITVKVMGENFNEQPKVPDDNLKFEPRDPPEGKTLREPFFDLKPVNDTRDSTERYIDLPNSNLGQYDLSLNKNTYTFSINTFINAAAKSFCPLTDGWDNQNICHNVPIPAGGYGTATAKDLDNTTVNIKEAGGYNVSNPYMFTVTFGTCGNQKYEPSKNEQCDGLIFPANLSCTKVGYASEKICVGVDDIRQVCTSDASCAGGEICLASCQFICDDNCELKVCDTEDPASCQSVINLTCGNGNIDNGENETINAGEICDGAELAGESCQSLGYLSGDLSCYEPGLRKQCKFDTSDCVKPVSCGNGKRERTLGEQCDASALPPDTVFPPNLACKSLGYPLENVCVNGPKEGQACTQNSECGLNGTCEPACVFDCLDSCRIKVCDRLIPNNCSFIEELTCGIPDPGYIINTEWEDCDCGSLDPTCTPAELNNKNCSTISKGNGLLNCYMTPVFGHRKCSYDIRGCSGSSSCGNGIRELDKGEQCDGTQFPPNLTCKRMKYSHENICFGGSKDSQPCSTNTDCPSGACSPSCTFECAGCLLKVCDAVTKQCKFVSDLLCNDGYIEPDLENCDCGSDKLCTTADELNNQTCQTLPEGYVTGNLTCYTEGSNKCMFDKNNCGGSGPPSARPFVQSTLPAHNLQDFCRNGIIDVNFNKIINPQTITKANVTVESCSSGPVAQVKKGVVYYIKQVFRHLFGLADKTLAQGSCTPLAATDYTLQTFDITGMSQLYIVPKNILSPEQYYRVTLSGAQALGIKDLAGNVLDNKNSSASGTVGKTPIADPANYIFMFKTRGTATDPQSGLCEVEWIDVNVYSQPFSTINPENYLQGLSSETRNDDLFICAGKDNCALSIDKDQDPLTSGNQHIYQAVAKFNANQILKANYKWARDDKLDPKRLLTLYNDKALESTGADSNVDANAVQNDRGITFVTAKAIKEAVVKLGVEALAAGTTSTKQRDFLVYLLLCENPWPGISEKFPVSSIINAYNFQTYYCRDAGQPGDTSDDLPAARWLAPKETNLRVLSNTDFEFGNLNFWTVLPNTAFNFQPVFSDILYKRIKVSANLQGSWWVNTYEKYRGNNWEDINQIQGYIPTGILQSSAFVIEGDELLFRIGGTAGPYPAEQDEVLTLSQLSNMSSYPTAVVLGIKDETMPNFKVVERLTPTNNRTMVDMSFNLTPYQPNRTCTETGDCLGFGSCSDGKCSLLTGIIYIYDNNSAGYISFDYLRQLSAGKEIPIRY